MSTIKAGVGKSNDSDSFKAGQQACEKAIEQMGQEPDLVMVFSSVALDQEQMLKGVNSKAGEAVVVGCSDSGEITTQGPISEYVAAMAVSAEKVKFVGGVGKGVEKDSHQAGKQAAQQVVKKAPQDLSMFVMFPDGTTGNGAGIVRGALEVLGEHFPLMGGSAGDDFKFEKTYQYFQDQVLHDVVVGLGICGDFSWGVGVKHGWEPIGLPMKVTDSEGAVLKELDGEPALNIYQEYFGKESEELIEEPIARMAYTYPLGMSVEGAPELLIRDVVIANEKGEITCAAEIPQGSEIRLMLGDREKAIQAAREAAQMALSQLEENDSSPELIWVFDCMARNKLLGRKTPQEIEAIQEVLGEEVPLLGFYTYGEQAPLGGKVDPKSCRSVFHNETLTLLTLGN